MIKQTIVALILSVGASSVFAAGTVKVFSNGSSEAKTLTGAEYLIDLVGQPRLANSWWPGAVISEELATAAALAAAAGVADTAGRTGCRFQRRRCRRD
ncbi:group 4 capsule (G4C) polysaccharide, YmcB [Escherichia coli]|nr:group 4 capsule (G4C) polysaccharide, YmcB [Escherichia coli]